MLHKSLYRRMWTASPRLTQQVSKIGRAQADRLAAAGVKDLVVLHDADPRRIEALTHRNYPFGALSWSYRVFINQEAAYQQAAVVCVSVQKL